MSRPYRPSFEKLENREVFSAGPLAPLSASLIATGTGQGAWDGDYGFDGVGLTASQSEPSPAANEYGHVLMLSLKDAPQSEPSALLQAGFAQGSANLKAVDHPLMDDVALHMILPYVEQDGVYKLSLPFSNTVLDDQAFVSQLYLDVLGRAGDAVAHDAVFAELGISELHWPESQEGNQIIAVLIGLLADGSPRGIPAGANKITDVTDGTSNTMMFSALAVDPSDPSGNTAYGPGSSANALVTDLVIDPFNSNGLMNSPENRSRILLSSSEYYRPTGDASGGIGRTTSSSPAADVNYFPEVQIDLEV